MSLSATRIRPSRPHARRAWLALAAALLALVTAAVLPLQAGGLRALPVADEVPGSHAAATGAGSARDGLALAPPAPSLDASPALGLLAESGSGESDDASPPTVHARWASAASPRHAAGNLRAPASRRPLQPRAQAPPAPG